MTDEEALRAAVLAHPDDDTPRLVYADWCDDAGDHDRAAFTRAQIEAARAEPWSYAARVAEQTANALLAAHAEEWTAHLDGTVETYGFARGFIEEVGLYAHRLTRGLDEACRAEPVRRVQVIRGLAQVSDAPLEEVFDSPHLSQITALDLRDANLTSSIEFEFVTEHEQLAGLTDLSLGGLRVPPEWLSRFLSGKSLPALTALDLSKIPNLGPALATGLTSAAHRRFTKLNVTGVRFLSGELQRVLASPPLKEVEELRVGWSYAGPGPLTMLDLGWVMPGARLRLLDVAGHGVGDDGVRELFTWRSPSGAPAAGCLWLGLARNAIGLDTVQRFLSSSPNRFHFLDVSGNGLPKQLIESLRSRNWQAEVVG